MSSAALQLRSLAYRMVQIYCGVSWELIMRIGTAPLLLVERFFGPAVWDTRLATVVLDVTYLTVLVSRLPVGFMRMAGLRDGFSQKFRGTPPLPDGSRPVVWIHAVSLGEMLMVRPLIARLVSERPDLQFVLSSRTKEGYDIAQRNFPDLAVFYAPFDFSWAVARAFDRLRPSALIIVEQDLWVNLMRVSERRGVPIAVVNGRMAPEDRRHLRRFNALPASAFAKIRVWTVTSAAGIGDVRTVTGPGFTNIEIAGFLKGDASALTTDIDESGLRLKELYGFQDDERVFVAGSTHYPEEAILLEAFQSLTARRPELNLRLVLVPRHEPFHIVEQLLIDRSVRYVKHSQINGRAKQSFPVTLVDRFGELPELWKFAHYGFVGGSLKPKWGGHNVLEPAAAGVPVCVGPYVSTFQDITGALAEAGGCVQVTNANGIERVLERWIDDPESAHRTGDCARSFVRSQQGATERTLAALDRALPSSREAYA